MSNVVTGVVESASDKDFGNGPVYSLKVNGTWYSFGFNQPSCARGDNVSFDTKTNGKYTNGVAASLEINSSGSSPSSSSSTSSGDNTVQNSIIYQSSRKDAIHFLEVAASLEAVKLPAKAADKLSVLEEMLDYYTLRFAWEAKSPTITDPAERKEVADNDDYLGQ